MYCSYLWPPLQVQATETDNENRYNAMSKNKSWLHK